MFGWARNASVCVDIGAFSLSDMFRFLSCTDHYFDDSQVYSYRLRWYRVHNPFLRCSEGKTEETQHEFVSVNFDYFAIEGNWAMG
jgi:hypothetical protein